MITLYNVADKVEAEESKVTTLVERNDYSTLRPLFARRGSARARTSPLLSRDREGSGRGPLRSESVRQCDAEPDRGRDRTRRRRKDRKTATDSARAAVIAGEDARRAAPSAGAAAEAERQRNEAAAAAATQEAQRAAAVQARQDLRNRLNAALPTEETDRGLVSEVGGVQFATGTANLNTSAREGLARFAGIVASYPGLRFNVEGHTDSTAASRPITICPCVAPARARIPHRTGNPAGTIDVAGLGPSRPVADNSTDEGRARNRRVEIILSGGPLAADGAEGVPLRAARD